MLLTYRVLVEIGLLLVEEGEEEGWSVGREKRRTQENEAETKESECWDDDRKSYRVG